MMNVGTVGHVVRHAGYPRLREVEISGTRADAGDVVVHADHELAAVSRVRQVPVAHRADGRQGRFGYIAALYHKVGCKQEKSFGEHRRRQGRRRVRQLASRFSLEL